MMPGLYVSPSGDACDGTPSMAVAGGMARLFRGRPDLERHLDLSLVPDGERSVEISMIDAHDRRGHGLGGLALDRLCALADEHGVRLWMQAVSLRSTLRRNEGALDQEQLEAFYARRGFSADPEPRTFNAMLRLPTASGTLLQKDESC
jgi:GNAT superfamily N-acetyltransferase